MTSYTSTAPQPSEQGWFSRSESWLDSKGKGAWIAAMVLGFVFFWPVGLALLFYMIWSKRMFSKSCSTRRKSWARHGMSAMTPSGNSAFDAYKADTLQRLEQEQHDFEAFLQRLRAAKDKSEFDEFMHERALQNDDEAIELDDEDDDDSSSRRSKRH
ncbi:MULTISPECIES: DUF2852 domain-containing protein [Phaeobacter]|uniref:DUF2852 domain-containing protein n=1 Tax=Phaeobacter piscinae TaxID=1580596 RepID=A0ABM6PEA0_9RHOB|nr:DUF2852 domain-containing protein [Phaeobacter piscinae]ATG36039.1 hypothetical protein PhaeoP36_01899 [Phaeobacter piscinae]ATG39922.1 hypothetical protein PhaeoP14_01824 [Phaeobacter piscinae]AUQ74034.1 hypothetical protein PhaeoP71_01162 [Phaeobacter piscinae]AUQ86560.1 hypothetical protein PhaeoP42_01900 [Phaeobacter piscinae]AUR24443.1 hypothetical protein PhaeoP23_01899 [Phaeobacter piscinae]